MITIWQWQGSLRKLGISLFLVLANAYAGIPLPDQNIAQGKGLTAGMGLGTLGNSSCETLWTWTGQVTYAYNSFISNGGSIRFLGGNLDSANNIVNQRYSINAKITDIKPNYVLFIGPAFSFENIDLNTLKKEFSNIGKENENANKTECRDLYSKMGSNIGYQSGAGFLITPKWGFTIGHDLDLTLKGVFMISFSSSIAFNLREQFEKLINNTKNVWLSLEISTTLIRSKFDSSNIIFGLAAGF